MKDIKPLVIKAVQNLDISNYSPDVGEDSVKVNTVAEDDKSNVMIEFSCTLSFNEALDGLMKIIESGK